MIPTSMSAPPVTKVESRASPPGRTLRLSSGQARGTPVPPAHVLFLNRPHETDHPLFYKRPSMATSTRNSSKSAAPPISQNDERERVFGLFRQFGYLEAELDPLGLLPPQPHPDLRFDNNNDNEWAREARRIYCGSVGVEFMHIADPERRRWIQNRIEARIGPEPAAVDIDRDRALDLLVRAELFEQTLQQRYLGNKRFSLEGSTSLLPAMDQVLDVAGERGAVELVMGMSHRGRLNVIIHLANRPPEQVFAEFEDVDPRSVLGSGDVKYHMGATGEYVTRSGKKIHIHLASNPSHLEAVDPVTVGRTRAKQDRAGEGGKAKYLPVLVHGDAAFAGQVRGGRGGGGSGDRRTHSRQAGSRRRRRQGEVSAGAGARRRRVRGARHHGGDAELCGPGRRHRR